jgi:hypothetical protein
LMEYEYSKEKVLPKFIAEAFGAAINNISHAECKPEVLEAT